MVCVGVVFYFYFLNTNPKACSSDVGTVEQS